MVELVCHYGHLAEDGSRIFQRVGSMLLASPVGVGDVVTRKTSRYEVLFRVFSEDGQLEALAVKPCEVSW